MSMIQILASAYFISIFLLAMMRYLVLEEVPPMRGTIWFMLFSCCFWLAVYQDSLK